jgi:dolichyl-phosphate-mannose--protein O-mannosyl transferase
MVIWYFLGILHLSWLNKATLRPPQTHESFNILSQSFLDDFFSFSFVLFAPLAYGIRDETPSNLPNSSVHHLKWIDSWEF